LLRTNFGWLKVSLAAVALIAVSRPASAVTLNFDDLVDNGIYHSTPVPYGYGGLQWYDWNYYSWSNPPYNPTSGSTRLLCEQPLHRIAQPFVRSDTGMIFEGASFTGYEGAGYGVMFRLYRNGALVFDSPSYLWTSATPQFLASGYTGVVDLVEVHGNFAFAAMDDFTFTAVPEPSAFAILSLGLSGLFLRRRRK